MTVLSPLEVIIALVLVFVLGGGGFALGCMVTTDRAEQRRADEAERRLAARPPRPPVTAQTWRPPQPGRLVAIAVEPDTTPMRVIPAFLGSLSSTAAWLTGRTPGREPGLKALTSPGSLEAELALSAHRTEIEIGELIRHAENTIGRLTAGGAPGDV
jgi:hypothetical protein